MPELSPDKLKTHRARTFCLAPGTRVASPAEALDFVNARGFAFFWPIKGVDLPSLWVAHAGDRPVADEHDDPGHTTWGWKDDALGRRIWYYAKVLRRKATMISLAAAPYFYALTENYGSPEEDHLVMYEEGRLTLAAKNIYEALLREGPLHTLELRKAARLSSAGSEPEFNRALEQLQVDFKILPIGVAPAGAWKYAFIYQVVARHYPELPEQARVIGEAEARAKLAGLYFQSVGAAQLRDVTRLFGWPPELAKRTLARLVEAGSVVDGVARADKPGDWVILKELLTTDG
jgi:hypothetical protein